MALLIWKAPLAYWSSRDEAAFFSWLQAIPGVVGVTGNGTELHIVLKSRRVSAEALRELLALYRRYDGQFEELSPFLNAGNAHWFRDPAAYWYRSVFGTDAKSYVLVRASAA